MVRTGNGLNRVLSGTTLGRQGGATSFLIEVIQPRIEGVDAEPTVRPSANHGPLGPYIGYLDDEGEKWSAKVDIALNFDDFSRALGRRVFTWWLV